MSGAPEPTVLQGLNFEATGRSRAWETFPYHQGLAPSLQSSMKAAADPNADIVAGLFARPSSDLTVANVLRAGS
jgi:hypothetical protein